MTPLVPPAILSFRYWQTYYQPAASERPRPCVPLFIHSPVIPGRYAFLHALVDSGADSALFDAAIARYLGLDLRSGRPKRTRGIGGAIQCWEHDLEITVFQRRFTTTVAFASRWQFEYGLLGAADIFSRFLLAFDQPNHLLLAEPHDAR